MHYFIIFALFFTSTLTAFASPLLTIEGLKSGSFIRIGNVYNSEDKAIIYSGKDGKDVHKIVQLGEIYIIEQLCDRETIMFVGNPQNQSVACFVK